MFLIGREHTGSAHYLLLVLVLLWVTLGSPIFPEEWLALPEAFLRMLRQYHGRMQVILIHWFC